MDITAHLGGFCHEKQKGDKKMIKKEWQSLLHNKILLVVLIAILAIPTIYTTLFLGSMWDPYGQLEQLPVAVVNEDKEVTYNEEKLNVGSQLVDNLKDNESLKFDFVDADTARKRLEDGEYYMVITIPENFSENASTLMDDKPQKMVLKYDTNPGKNYIATKMSESAMSKIKDSVAAEVTQTYAQVMFDQITTVGDGMQEAADGSGTLEDGLVQLSDGNTKITDNLQLLSDSTLTFKDGSEELYQGLEKYTAGVGQVNDGSKQLDDGATQLKGGIDELNSKVPELSDGVGQLAVGADGLSKGTAQVLEGGKQLKDGSSQVDENLSALNGGLSQLKEQTAQLPDATAQLNTGAQKLESGAANLQAGAEGLDAGVRKLQSGATSLNTGLAQLSGDGADQLYGGLDVVKEGLVTQLMQVIDNAGSQPVTTGSYDTSSLQSRLQAVAASSNEANARAASLSGTADSISTSNSGQDASYLSDALNDAVSSGNIDQVAAIANQAIEVAQNNSAAADAANAQTQTAVSALREGSDALYAAGSAMDQVSGIADELPTSIITDSKAKTDASNGDLQAALEYAVGTALDTYRDQALKTYVGKVKAAKDGSDVLLAGINGVTDGNGTIVTTGLLQGTEALKSGTGEIKSGLTTLSLGTSQLKESAPALTAGISAAQAGGSQLQQQGTAVLNKGSDDLYQGLVQINDGGSALNAGTKTLAGKLPELSSGVTKLADGANQLKEGTTGLVDGTKELVSNSSTLLSGSSQLSSGASQIRDGAGQLADGSVTLGNGLNDALDGSNTLKSSLADGAAQVKEVSANDDTLGMFGDPVDAEETQITEVKNNGHAMAAYMMSVGLWVACIAFCIMYPLTEHEGELRSGFSWWLSKATVVYPIAIGMALAMVGMLHLINGFSPVELGKTIIVACIASTAFMSIMYFFNVWLGKVGSFIMLIFMVVQLAGSAGTYPIELSGSFVAKIHKWLPFSYTVDAFRATIAGGSRISQTVLVLLGLIVVFTILTIWMFQIRAVRIKRGKSNLYDFIEKSGLA